MEQRIHNSTVVWEQTRKATTQFGGKQKGVLFYFLLGRFGLCGIGSLSVWLAHQLTVR